MHVGPVPTAGSEHEQVPFWRAVPRLLHVISSEYSQLGPVYPGLQIHLLLVESGTPASPEQSLGGVVVVVVVVEMVVVVIVVVVVVAEVVVVDIVVEVVVKVHCPLMRWYPRSSVSAHLIQTSPSLPDNPT